ncbi:MAG: flagellar filament outer layer protein FlaA [Spirochaetes bacterium]|nr:flagellar filament outer layer protein FlaA [Spirochaetota bacterium]
MIKKFVFSIIILLLSGSFVFAEGEDYRSTRKIMSIQAPVISDFENTALVGQWILGETSPNCDKDITAVKAAPGGPWGLAVPDEGKKTCLGIKSGFKTRGYNYAEILPPVFRSDDYPGLKNLFNTIIPNPLNERFIPMPGKVQSVDVWVAGRNFRYNLEIWLKDYNGFVYALEMGKINFQGWRNLSRQMPEYIPQEEKYLPKEKPLKFLKFIVRSDPDERADKIYMYFDHMKVITDVYIERFDGDDIKDTW